MIAIWLNTSGFAMKWWYYPIVLVGSVCVFIVLGYFEVKSGMLRYEQEKYISENPGFDRVFKELQEIKDKL